LAISRKVLVNRSEHATGNVSSSHGYSCLGIIEFIQRSTSLLGSIVLYLVVLIFLIILVLNLVLIQVFFSFANFKDERVLGINEIEFSILILKRSRNEILRVSGLNGLNI